MQALSRLALLDRLATYSEVYNKGLQQGYAAAHEVANYLWHEKELGLVKPVL